MESRLRTITAILPLRNGQVALGTRAGLYISDGNAWRALHPHFAHTEVTALAGEEDQIWIGTRADGAWFWRGGEAVHLDNLPDRQVLSICARGDRAWVGTPLGVAEFAAEKYNRPLADGVFARALAEDRGTLWVGTMDEGTLAIPLLTGPFPAGRTRRYHTENDILFCVNRIKHDPRNGIIAVGTANGLALFDSNGELRQILDRKAGLISNNITDVLFRYNGERTRSMVVATPAGLSFVEDGAISSMYGFQGLVSIARFKPTAFQAVSFERISTRMREWPSIGIAGTRCAISSITWCGSLSTGIRFCAARWRSVPAI